MRVADFGVGGGAYVIATAKKVGDTGKVYAIDVQKELVSKVKKMAQDEGLENVETLWGDIEEVGGAKLSDGAVDSYFIQCVVSG